MKGSFGLVAGIFLMTAGGVFATPPTSGQHFNCSDAPGATSCPNTDDAGCVPADKNNSKCSDSLVKAFGKAVASVIKCHKKQADSVFASKSFDEEACETANDGKSAKAKLDAAIAKVAPLCTNNQLTGAGVEESVLFATKSQALSLDAQNAGVYCQGANDIDPGGDDAGKIPDSTTPAAKDVLKCEDAVGGNLGKLVAAAIGCHVKMADSFFKAKDFDEEACEESDPVKHKAALEKFNAARDKLLAKGICPSCLDQSGQDTLAANALATVDGANSLVYPCPASTTTTVTTLPAGTTTTTTVPGGCTCTGGTPSKLSFTTGLAGGTCGTLKNNAGAVFANLTCGGLYFGGDAVAVPLPSVIPDQGTSVTNVSCTGTALTLSGTTPAQAGGNRCSGGTAHGSSCTSNSDCPGGSCSFLKCTNQGCLFGPPLPIPNNSGAATSTCIVNVVSANASGSADCGTGATSSLSLPLTSNLYLTGDLLTNRCSGGPTPGKGCSVNTDCGAGGTCVNDQGRCRDNGAVCVGNADCSVTSECDPGVCAGGGNAGKGCIVDADCPSSSCTTLIQPCPICNPNTHVCNGGPNDGLACVAGDSAINGDYPTSHDCPPPAGLFLGPLPIAFNLTSGTLVTTAIDTTSQSDVFCGFCGNGAGTSFSNTACTADAQCTTVPFTHCRQKDPGAFSGDDIARTITVTGAPATGITVGGAPKASKLVTTFCIPSTPQALVNASADLPGPGATMLTGTVTLQ